MKSILFSFCLLFINCFHGFAQDLTVPENILKELSSVVVQGSSANESVTAFKVVYPENYDPTIAYPVFLALSGGDQSEAIVDYCYAAWFRSPHFKHHLSILPISPKGKNMRDFSEEEITALVATIKERFNVTPNNWIIAGTSNGGVATFNFIANSPELYAGAIVIPGVLAQSIKIDGNWKHLKVLLACGEKDAKDWIEGSKKAEEKLSNQVSSVSYMVLKGQGHILPIGFDIDQIYKAYFESPLIKTN